MSDPTATVIGLVVEKLRAWFTPTQAQPPRCGGTNTIHIVAGEQAPIPPFLNDECGGDCSNPFIWVRLSDRFRTSNFPARQQAGETCRSKRALSIEVGIARCAPVEPTACDDDLEERAACQWDDSWRIDNAICAALQAAAAAGVITDSAIGQGDPYGPDGGLIAWTQTASAQL